MTSILSRSRGILLDIEGTITPITFVHDVLFPYARAHVKDYLALHFDAAEASADLAKLREEHALDLQQRREPPPLVAAPREDAIDSFVSYVFWLMDQDRKSPGLKSLQGKIWEQGYTDGYLTAPLFADVLPALEKLRRAGLQTAIFSSGSVLAQKLLFKHTNAGDVSALIDRYFDTTTGPKTASAGYRQIALVLGLAAAEVVFISDVVAELDAACAAGMQTLLCVRPGNQPQTPHSRHRVIDSFAQLDEMKLHHLPSAN
jgi:enolase-phosphatase E1